MASTNDTVEPREIKVSVRDRDGTADSIITLAENKDATKPPCSFKICKRSITPPDTHSTVPHRETHVVLSVGSGDRQAENFFQNVVKPILITAIYGDEGASVLNMHMTTSATSISNLTQNTFFPAANSGNPIRIILLSGDGGIVDVVNGLLSQPQSHVYTSPEVVLLPLGTANALYHSMHAGKSMTWGIDALSPGTTTAQPLPVFVATFSPGARLLVDEARREEALPKNDMGNGILHGAVVASWGMHASLVGDSDTAQYRQYGVERFKMAAKEALYPVDGSLPHAYKASVSVLKDGEWRDMKEKEHMYVLATLVSHLEQSFCISPKSRPLDGSMHLVHFGPTSGHHVMRIMGLAYQGGKHVEDEHVRYENIDGLRIQFQGMEEDARWRRICIDGKIVMVEAEGWVEVRKHEKRVLNVVVA